MSEFNNMQRPEDLFKSFADKVASGELVLESALWDGLQHYTREMTFSFHQATKYLVFVPKTRRNFVYSKSPNGLQPKHCDENVGRKESFNQKEIERYRLEEYEQEEVESDDHE
jgi:hypothetical protein